MKKITTGILIILFFSFYVLSPGTAQVRERSDVPDKYKWDLSGLFVSDKAWAEAKMKTDAMIDKIPSFKGTLAESASKLLECLEFTNETRKELRRLSSYSWNKTRQDLRDPKYRAMSAEFNQLNTKFNANTSFINPEIIGMGEKIIKKFINRQPGLKPYSFSFYNLIRRGKYTLSQGEEKVIAEAGRMAPAPASLYNELINSGLLRIDVTLSTGEIIELNLRNFRRYRGLSHQGDRELVYKTFFGELGKYYRTFGSLLNAKVNVDLFNTRARGYSDCLEMKLEPNNIQGAVFHNFIDCANKNLDKFHRYLKIRQHLLEVDSLNLTDLSVSTFRDIDLNYDVEEARELILKSLKPLGNEYTSIVKNAFENRWIDFYPTPGKRSNAYTDLGGYAEHPFILMNYTGRYNDVAVLIHEMGHALHRYFADRGQPIQTANYSSFVAEVAAIFNEILLKKAVLEEIKDDNLRLYFLLNRFESSLFIRAMNSEFELKIHQEAEKGKSLTGESISKIYLETLRKYYGHDKGICTIPEYFGGEWILNRLFFINTYRLYVYATSRTAAVVLADKVLKGEKGAVEKYLDFLSAGGSDYPVSILKRAGVDMMSTVPFESTMMNMDLALDEIERILKKKGR
jgi:oligoendopeptidase F